MPSLMRFLGVLGVIAALGLGAVYSLATFVAPRTREMTVTIPSARLRPPPLAEAQASPSNPQTAGAEAEASEAAAR
jgi:hypothetical protein